MSPLSQIGTSSPTVSIDLILIALLAFSAFVFYIAQLRKDHISELELCLQGRDITGDLRVTMLEIFKDEGISITKFNEKSGVLVNTFTKIVSAILIDM